MYRRNLRILKRFGRNRGYRNRASSSQQRTAGMEWAIGEYEGITVVESQSANYDQDTAAATMAEAS